MLISRPGKDYNNRGGSAPKEVLNIDDVAKLLDVHPNTVRNLVHLNKLPHQRVGRQYRFLRSQVLSWLGWGA